MKLTWPILAAKLQEEENTSQKLRLEVANIAKEKDTEVERLNQDNKKLQIEIEQLR